MVDRAEGLNMPADDPEHYKARGTLECFDAFQQWAGTDAAIHACMFNVFKYLYRHDLKADSPDDIDTNLKKLDWYRNRLAELQRSKNNG